MGDQVMTEQQFAEHINAMPEDVFQAFVDELSDDDFEAFLGRYRAGLEQIETEPEGPAEVDPRDEFEQVLEFHAPEISGFIKKLGRKPTHAEQRGLVEMFAEQHSAGRPIDPDAAWKEFHEREGRKPYDPLTATDAERHQHMRERLRDQEEADRPDDSEREYDIDNNDQDRRDYFAARMAGAERVDVGPAPEPEGEPEAA